jgi:predicted enzyme related to lactoylglutathione lyase
MFMNPPLNAIMIYARDMERTAGFYATHFGFTKGELSEGLIRLTPRNGGAGIVIHQAAKGIKLGHVGIKLVFDVEDVEAFKKASAARGLVFGATHAANRYCFANAKDPDKNSVSISSRAFRKRPSA